MDMLASDVQEIKSDLKELTKQGIIHNELLRQHEARSLALQESQKLLDMRIKPIEIHVEFLNILGKVVLTVFTGSLVYLVGRWLIH